MVLIVFQSNIMLHALIYRKIDLFYVGKHHFM